MRIEIYRRQHKHLRMLLAETSRYLVPLDADACRAALNRLAIFLNVHLTLEDRALYPRLMTHDSPVVRKIAKDYQYRMGRLAANFRAFYDKWSRLGEIESAAYDFALAYRTLSESLRQRMDMEDTTLYSLVELGN